MTVNRRDFVKWIGAGAALGAASLYGCATTPRASAGKVVVVGGGYAGATAAKYIRMWEPAIEVILVEPNASFVSCPFSNRVLGGSMTIDELTIGYDKLEKVRGVTRIRDQAVAIDADRRQVRLARGDALGYDRLILAPGIDFALEQLPGLEKAIAEERVLHSWKAGPQTVALRKQLEAMRDGGVFALWIPKSPYRCPPGPYERATQVAYYFKNHKPKSKVVILDANEDIQSKKGLFLKVWQGMYPGIVEYRANSEYVGYDAATNTIKVLTGDVRADVLNVIPPQRAGRIARDAGLADVNARFCGVDFLTYESTVAKNVHVIGDSIQAAPAMPKSGHMANQHGKICADAVIALMTGRAVNDQPIIANTCYSWVSNREVVHVASVHKYDRDKKTMVTVPGAGGLSPAPSVKEGAFAMGWAESIWSDTLA
jgi:NADPH-dependent 2,4-dienoyl-CoA reductase/sulfur reductase-like enzyme